MSVSQAELDALLAGLTPAPSELLCTVCGTRLDEMHRDVGTHPTCEPEPAAAEEPPSTIAALRGILVDFEANSARTLQVAPGPSEIAVGCDRRLAYRTLSTPEQPDGRVKWAPLIGTAVHALIAEALHADNQRTMAAGAQRARWLVEERVHPDPAVSGSCDAYDTETDTVVDWKVVGPTSLTKYRRHGPGPQYEGQIQIYGRGWQRAGRSPHWVRIVFLARGHDYEQAYEWTAPYSRTAADAAIDRLYRIVALTADLKLADTPALWGAVPANPGDDCRYCPYHRRGRPADDTGCPGDVAADERRDQKFTEGLIA
jgi:hypothetical protein